MKILTRGGLIPALLTLLALLLAIATFAEALANRDLQSLVILPSYERLLQATWLALGFALLALLWQVRAALVGRGD